MSERSSSRPALAHLFWWFMFAQGGVIAAILLPVHILFQGILGPLVIDPLRDIERYLAVADDLNVKITRALDTHLHNDYVSGCRELAAEAGAEITAVDAGDEVRVGDLEIRAMHTPGHTPDHKSYLLS